MAAPTDATALELAGLIRSGAVSPAEVVEAHHVTGDDCFILKVLARSMRDLERISGRVAALGSTTTSVVYSSPLERRAVLPG